eukprot:gnl/TRDRNA2_/TRDRNA2_40048_c0_seq2.p1 gnl/TRDRNA2_/TRDRNA2_40048_c0~~gnl/TRDRNA2_/TRDRNA2_40048_c0_seq2.p1  ORF type:complete len:121 (+),score=23.06 gnl/TRDRNA2_/TRDRNA2_40048_c0_seq2:46-363(+)
MEVERAVVSFIEGHMTGPQCDVLSELLARTKGREIFEGIKEHASDLYNDADREFVMTLNKMAHHGTSLDKKPRTYGICIDGLQEIWRTDAPHNWDLDKFGKKFEL